VDVETIVSDLNKVEKIDKLKKNNKKGEGREKCPGAPPSYENLGPLLGKWAAFFIFGICFPHGFFFLHLFSSLRILPSLCLSFNLANAFGLLSNNKAELITTDMHRLLQEQL